MTNFSSRPVEPPEQTDWRVADEAGRQHREQDDPRRSLENIRRIRAERDQTVKELGSHPFRLAEEERQRAGGERHEQEQQAADQEPQRIFRGADQRMFAGQGVDRDAEQEVAHRRQRHAADQHAQQQRFRLRQEHIQLAVRHDGRDAGVIAEQHVRPAESARADAPQQHDVPQIPAVHGRKACEENRPEHEPDAVVHEHHDRQHEEAGPILHRGGQIQLPARQHVPQDAGCAPDAAPAAAGQPNRR